MKDHQTGARALAILLPSLGGGGAERVCLTLAREFVRLGHRVDVVVLEGSGELIDQVPAGARLIVLDRRMKGALPRLTAYFRRERPDAIYANMWPLTWVAVLARIHARLPSKLILVEHVDFRMGFHLFPKSQWLMATFGRWFYPRADHVICVSSGAADGLAHKARIDRGIIETIFNPVDLPSSTGIPRDIEVHEWWMASPNRILSLGRLIAQKDYATLIAAIAAIPPDRDLRLLILGDGPDEADLQILIDRHRQNDRIRLGGFQPDRENYLANASLYVLSSQWEGLPTVLIEALVAGVPIVSTDCRSGPDEILDHGKFGKLVPVGDPEKLAAAIIDALCENTDRDMLRMRAKTFDPGNAARNYLSLISSPANWR